MFFLLFFLVFFWIGLDTVISTDETVRLRCSESTGRGKGRGKPSPKGLRVIGRMGDWKGSASKPPVAQRAGGILACSILQSLLIGTPGLSLDGTE